MLHRADDLPAAIQPRPAAEDLDRARVRAAVQLLLVDEPFVGLDATGKLALLDLLDALHDAGVATLVATHDAQYVERVTRCVALRDGELIHDGKATPDDVLRLVGA